MPDGFPHGGPLSEAIVRKTQTFGLLDQLCQELELTETQAQTAKSAYGAVGRWLAESPNALLASSEIYAQGSAAHGTTVKPLHGNEHDVDLVNHIKAAPANLDPGYVKSLIGDRLRQHGTYAAILVEMQRCWRLNYANEFHLDITPSIRNPACSSGGELVPDKALKSWKPSNPKGFRDLFAKRADLRPRSSELMTEDGVMAKAMVVPFPEQSAIKGVLRRTVQLLKRHRDLYFEELDPSLAPLSIIITTLASRAYEYCVKTFPYDNELDLLLDAIRFMPTFIETKVIAGRKHYFVWNETTEGENFAEKWNLHPERAEAFHRWQRKVLGDFEQLIELEGIDALAGAAGRFLGEELTQRAVRKTVDAVSAARRAGTLAVVPGVGLATSATAGTVVRPHTFFGIRQED